MILRRRDVPFDTSAATHFVHARMCFRGARGFRGSNHQMCELVVYGRGGGIRTLDLLNPIQARCQAAPHPEDNSYDLRSESVATGDVLELPRRNSSAGALPTLREEIAWITYPSEPSAGHRNPRVRMAAHTKRSIALEAQLPSKAPQCALCLIRLDCTEPSACPG